MIGVIGSKKLGKDVKETGRVFAEIRVCKTISQKLKAAKGSRAARVLQGEPERRLYDQGDIERASLSPGLVRLRMSSSCSTGKMAEEG